MAEPPETDSRALAVSLFNGVWGLLDTERDAAADDRMLHMAHASRFHWEAVGDAANLGPGRVAVSRVYAVLGRAEPCLHHAHRVLGLCAEHGIADWDLGFGYEALARGYAVAGDADAARRASEQALAVEVSDPEDRELLLADLETIPGQPPQRREGTGGVLHRVTRRGGRLCR